MGLYLNSDRSLKNYEELYRSDYFVDKSLIIERLNKLIGKRSKYLCITRPRRFGKTSVADMVAAYYSKAVDSKDIFDNLNISKVNSYEENLNKYNVINISFNKMPDSGKTYDNYINMIKQSLISDIVKYYPNINPHEFFTVGDILESTGDQFIFVLDEWDYIFSKDLFQENQDDFLEFLTFLLKDKPYVLLCYMTGVLPIKRYSSGSALNMFDEFTFLKDRRFGEFFGFTTDEVLKLCDENQYMNFEKLELWYNGYTTANGVKIYNPRSVVKALENNYCESYWTNTGAMDEVSQYLKYNVLEIRDDVIQMVAGEEIDITINEEFRAGQGIPKTKEENYKDKFLDREYFQWQSPNSTTQSSDRGKNLIFNKDRKINLHLFVRKYKMIDKKSQPYIYIGTGDTVEYNGEKPITMKIKLHNEVPSKIYREFIQKV